MICSGSKPCDSGLSRSAFCNAVRTWRKFQPSTKVTLLRDSSPRTSLRSRLRGVLPGSNS